MIVEWAFRPFAPEAHVIKQCVSCGNTLSTRRKLNFGAWTPENFLGGTLIYGTPISGILLDFLASNSAIYGVNIRY